MTTVRSIQVTSGANARHFSRRAKVAAGATALGCAVALALGGWRAGDAARTQPPLTPMPPVVRASGHERLRFLEENTWLPAAILPDANAPAGRVPTKWDDLRNERVPARIPTKWDDLRDQHR